MSPACASSGGSTGAAHLNEGQAAARTAGDSFFQRTERNDHGQLGKTHLDLCCHPHPTSAACVHQLCAGRDAIVTTQYTPKEAQTHPFLSHLPCQAIYTLFCPGARFGTYEQASYSSSSSLKVPQGYARTHSAPVPPSLTSDQQGGWHLAHLNP